MKQLTLHPEWLLPRQTRHRLNVIAPLGPGSKRD